LALVGWALGLVTLWLRLPCRVRLLLVLVLVLVLVVLLVLLVLVRIVLGLKLVLRVRVRLVLLLVPLVGPVVQGGGADDLLLLPIVLRLFRLRLLSGPVLRGGWLGLRRGLRQE
jgi:hypothetical protein